MLNYGEELVYWYLRLNGFFLLENFVLHRNNQYTSERTSDSDILAVRFPHVSEEIGGDSDDWDVKLLDHFDSESIIGLICEVKTGQNFNVNKHFEASRVEKAIRRFGFVSDYQKILNSLSLNSVASINEFQVGKILFSKKKSIVPDKFIDIKLVDVNRFIKKRIAKYLESKFADRMFFPSNLMQYIIWEEKRKSDRKQQEI
jgi:hypothetical protein